MLARDILVELDGALMMGPAGERLFGRRHFMEVTSMFLTEPLMTVRWGGRMLGQVDPWLLDAGAAGDLKAAGRRGRGARGGCATGRLVV